MRRTFLCYAFNEGGVWEALCLDLDIAVHGHSFEQVDARLKAAIQEYLEALKNLPERDRKRLLSRKVPLWERLRFAYKFVRSFFRPSEQADYHQFTLSYAASPI